MASALEILDTTVVNVALPQMEGNLGATTDEIAWVSTGYILSNVIVLPMTAWLSGRFGRKRYLMVSILIFNIARFMCGLSATLEEIIFWRLVQGAGGAALISTAQSTLVEIFPRSQIATVQSLFGLGLIVTPTPGAGSGRFYHGQLFLAHHFLYSRPAWHRFPVFGRLVFTGLAASEACQHSRFGGDYNAGSGDGIAAIRSGRRRTV